MSQILERYGRMAGPLRNSKRFLALADQLRAVALVEHD
jgi:hypothetical protein